MNLPDWIRDEVSLRAEADRRKRRVAYDAWAKAYGAPMVTIRSLELTKVCQSCGRPYFIAAGHDCPGPRLSVSRLPEETPA